MFSSHRAHWIQTSIVQMKYSTVQSTQSFLGRFDLLLRVLKIPSHRWLSAKPLKQDLPETRKLM